MLRIGDPVTLLAGFRLANLGTALGGCLPAGSRPRDAGGRAIQKWLGRTQYGQDPHFNGWLQDSRIYGSALGAAQVQALAQPGRAHRQPARWLVVTQGPVRPSSSQSHSACASISSTTPSP